MRPSFITWYPYCRRSDTIATELGGPSHLIHYLSFKRPLQAPLKYVMQTLRTLWVLQREKPDVVFVAVPPIFAALPVLLWARLRGSTRVVIDAHTGIFEHARWSWLLPLTRWSFRRADSVIVTGKHLKNLVESWGAHAIVIGTVPVRFCEGQKPAACSGARVVVVNTFSVDEPVGEVLAAARALDQTRVFITGDVRHADRTWIESKPKNVEFTGFVSEEEYAGLMRAADVVVVLTTHDHTMQRGGYEAMALERPLVTSDWQLLRETFSRGTIHVDNNSTAIAAGIAAAVADGDRLVREMRVLRAEHEELFSARLRELCDRVGLDSQSVRTAEIAAANPPYAFETQSQGD